MKKILIKDAATLVTYESSKKTHESLYLQFKNLKDDQSNKNLVRLGSAWTKSSSYIRA